MKDADERWLDGLAGRDDTSADNREGQTLRAALLARAEPPVNTVDAEDEAERAAALIARARMQTGGARNGPAAWPARWLAAAAGVLVAAVVWMVAGTPDSAQTSETLRGPSAAAVSLQVANPQAARFEMVDLLQTHGVPVSAIDHFGQPALMAHLPDPLPPELIEGLGAQGVPAPEPGPLRVEFTLQP